MDYLADSNILLHGLKQSDPMCRAIRAAIRTLQNDGHRLCIFPQNLIEFWSVSTRPPERNGLGITLQLTNRYITEAESLFELLPEPPAIYREWRRLVVENSVAGLQVFDTRLVAAMTLYGITNVLTLNVKHFKRYGGITPIHPDDVEHS